MIEKILLATAYLMATIITCFFFRSFRSGSPIFWFPVALAIMALGTIVLIDPRSNVDLLYVALHFLALFSFVVASAAHLAVLNAPKKLAAFEASPYTASAHNGIVVTVGVFVFSVVITMLYYKAVGFNIVGLILTGAGIADYSTMRLSSYSGVDYFAPGYVNQFKNVLLPISTVAIMYWLYRAGKKLELGVFSAFALPFLIYALAGTGQRGYLFYTGVALILGFTLHTLGGKFRIFSARILAFAAPVLILFGIMTMSYYERGDQGLLNLAGDILTRFTTIQQEGALVGFHYVHSLPIAWFSEWQASFAGILPGEPGSTMSHEIHAIMYGTDRGTVPLSTVGSAYYNGGVFGIILLFAVMGYAYARLYIMYISGEREIVRSLTYGLVFFYLIIFLVDSPAILLDNGVLTGLLFLGLLGVAKGRGASVPEAGHLQR